MEVSGQLHAPAALSLGISPPGTHSIGGWVGGHVATPTPTKYIEVTGTVWRWEEETEQGNRKVTTEYVNRDDVKAQEKHIRATIGGARKNSMALRHMGLPSHLVWSVIFFRAEL
jgi:hypothetical protein